MTRGVSSGEQMLIAWDGMPLSSLFLGRITMTNYHALNKWVLANRDGPLLVIYKKGSKSIKECLELTPLESLHFHHDGEDLRNRICGYQVGGIIVEPGANFGKHNLRYAISRLRSEDNVYLFLMDEEHEDILEDIFEEYYESATNKEMVESLRSQIVIYDPECFYGLQNI
jgi:hypothetical protein